MMIEPKLRFKADDGSDFPDWEEQKIEDVCVLNPRTEQLDDEFYYMDLGSIDHGRWEAPEIVKKVDAPSRAQRVAAIDDVFFQSVRPYNMGHYHYVAAKDKQVVASTGYIQARMRNGSNAFLYQLFYEERFNAEVNARCTGSNYPAINSRKFGEITVALPSLPEQRKIADLLSAVDDVIAAQEAEVAAWEKRKKGVMQKLFSQEVRFKADDGSEFPEWEEKTLGDLGRLRNGYAFKSDTYVPHGKYRVITIANVQGERYVTELERANTVNQIPDNIASWQILKESDILISLTGNIGRVSLNTGCDNLLNQRVGLFEVFSPISDRQWVFQRLSANDFRNAMEGEGQGAAQKNISRGDVESFPLSVPSLPEQRKIADCLTSLDDVIAKAKDELDAWRELKKGLLQQMFV